MSQNQSRSSSHSQETVLVTGTTGFVGFRVLVEALRAGYAVRAAVRSVARAEALILDKPSIRALQPGERLAFVEVPDMTAAGAFDAALAGGVTHVIHVASPRPADYRGDAQRELIDPAVHSVTGLLSSAARSPAVRRAVLTSSVFANRHLSTVSDAAVRTDAATRVAMPQGPFDAPLAAYAASKTAALAAADAFMAQRRPHFDLITVFPGHVVGPNELAGDTAALMRSTAPAPIRALVGEPPAEPLKVWSSTVLVDDLARLHVLVLRPGVAGNQGFGAVQPGRLEEAFAWVKEAFPDAVARGVFRDNAFHAMPICWDASRTVEVFGEDMSFAGLRESTVRVAQQYLELLAKEEEEQPRP